MDSIRALFNLFFSLTMFLLFFVAAEAMGAMRDPTRPPSYRGSFQSESLDREFKISAIFFGEKNKSVIIEDILFTVGDKVSGYTITAINRDSVELRDKNGEFKFVMPHPKIKTPVKKEIKSEK